MAKSSNKPAKRKLSVKKSPTVREQAKKSKNNGSKKRRLGSVKAKVSKPFSAAKKTGKKEYYIPMPDNKVGRFMNKKRRLTPKYFVEAWQELKLVTWPDRKETTKLTIAVILFAVIFGVLIAIVDYGLDKIFRELLLK